MCHHLSISSLFLFVEEHLQSQSSHHKRHNGYGYSQHYQYSFSHLGKQKNSLSAPISLLPLKDWTLSFLHWIIESIFIVNNWLYAFLLFFFGIFFSQNQSVFKKTVILFISSIVSVIRLQKYIFFLFWIILSSKRRKNDGIFFFPSPLHCLCLYWQYAQFHRIARRKAVRVDWPTGKRLFMIADCTAMRGTGTTSGSIWRHNF